MKIGVTGLDVIAGQGFLIVGPLGEGPLEDWCGLVPTGRRSAQAQRRCLIGDLQDRRAAAAAGGAAAAAAVRVVPAR